MVKKSELRQDINWQKVEDFDPKGLVPHYYRLNKTLKSKDIVS